MPDLWTLLQLVPIGILFYFYINRKYSYWSARGVPGPRAIFPFGYSLDRATTYPDVYETDLTRQYGKVFGLYTGLLPTLTVNDAELIKQVLVKDFHLYLNRRKLNVNHAYWNLNQFNSEDANWKRIRSITGPAFTSGKLRQMYSLMGKCITRLVSFLDKTATTGNGVINTKEVMAGFTIDVISSAAFATETNANGDRAQENPTVYHGMNIFRFNPFKVMAAYSLPGSLLRLLGIDTFFPNDSLEYFVQLTKQIVEQRRANPNIKSNDLIQLMMDSFAYEEDLLNNNYDSLTASMDKEENKEKPSDDQFKTKKQMNATEIVAQCIVFLIAGYETTASTLTHSLFELVHNPDIEERLVREIEEATHGLDPEKNQEEFFESLLGSRTPYLEAVVKETLRKYPSVVRLERRVGPEGAKLNGIQLDPGTLIEVSTVGVHRNPEYYPEPERFQPERFLPENKDKLVPYTYIPFGQGPRNCVGMRFAYQEVRLCLGLVLSKFRFAKTANTPAKLAFQKGNLMLNCVPFELSVSTR